MNKLKLIPKAVSYKNRSVKFVNGWAKVPSDIDMRQIRNNIPQEFVIERGLDGKYWIAEFTPLDEVKENVPEEE